MPDSRPVGFYVHHHGGGHANRSTLLADAWSDRRAATLFTSAPRYIGDWAGGTVVELPPDVRPGRDPTQDLLNDQVVHYAPIDLPGLSQRMATVARWIATHQPAWFIVDLSVEVALLARLCGARTALVRLNGKRNDRAHRAAFGLVDALIAPFPEALEDDDTPNWVRDKTIYLGAFSRYDGRTESTQAARRAIGFSGRRLATVINGSGGGQQSADYWSAVAAANPNWEWWLVGRIQGLSDPPPNLKPVGFRADTYPYLKAADVVIGSGGTNTMLEIGAARRPYLSRPEPRPFAEQVSKMEALARLGLTRIVPLDTAPKAYESLLEAASEQPTERWDELFANDGLKEAVNALESQLT